ncbi:Transcription termination/antitermination protein NusG [Methylobacterium soli]|nr:Transcription termination/antitermination protein NusG [Methylobacterium soli]
MTNIENTARQAKALARKKKGKAAMRRARKAKPYQRAALPTPERVRARAKTERFEVDEARDWVVVRTEQNRASRCASALRERGFPVFEARQEERLVAENGKARVAQVPLLRRLLFVGLNAADTPGDLTSVQYVESMWARGEEAWIWTPREWLGSARPIRIGPLAMQKFADHITGHRRNGKLVPDLIKALFKAGETIRITDGPFATYNGIIERIDAPRGRYTVLASIFGRATPVELNEDQLEAA